MQSWHATSSPLHRLLSQALARQHTSCPVTSHCSDMSDLADPPFTTELREATSGQHKTSNRLVHLTAPLALSSQPVYASLLTSFYYIFQSLENELETRRRQHPRISGIYMPAIMRTKAIEADLSYHLSKPFTPSPMTAATKEWIAEMKQAVEEDPVVLVAYVHTLYAALLAGGQIIRGWVLKAFGGGVKLFEFDDKKNMLEDFKGTVNRLALNRDEKDRVVQFKKRVFEANDRVFAELRQSQVYRKRVMNILGFVVGILVLLIILRLALVRFGG